MAAKQTNVYGSVENAAANSVSPNGERQSARAFHTILWNVDWSHVSGGIIVAAFAYPFVLLIAVSVIAMFVSAIVGSARVVPVIMFGFVVGAIPLAFAAFFGMIWAGIVNACITPLMHAVIRSLELRPNVVLYGAFKGGLVGFLALLPLGYFVHTPTVPIFEWTGPLLFGPCLATMVGQIGGAWGGKKANWYEREVASPQVAATGREAILTGQHVARPSSVARVQFRFGVRHMLWVTTWLSMLLALIRLTGLPFGMSLAILVGWIIFQSFTLFVGGKLILRLGPWWSRRRRSRAT